jgi:hypothetical protein
MFLERDDEFLVHEVNHSVRQLCKTIDAFIFVVDSSTTKEKGKCTLSFSFFRYIFRGFYHAGKQ